MVRNSNSFLPSDSRDCHSLVQCRRPRLEKRFIDSLYIAYTALLNFQANTMYHQSASLPSQYTCSIESMYTVYCLYLPNLVKASYEKLAKRLKVNQIVIFASAAVDCLKSRDN